MKRHALAVLFSILSVSVQATENPWVAMTRQDLQAIHDILQENHPGPVDPENARYADWLKQGIKQARERAQSAVSFADHIRALLFYTNGFQDGHLGIGLEMRPEELIWPGLIVDQDANGLPRVVHAEPDSGVIIGAQVISCDGRTIDALLAERVDPYFWNSAIPHERNSHLFRLFYQDRRDSQKRIQFCQFSAGEVKLLWRAESTPDFEKRLESMGGARGTDPQLRQINGVWMITVPTLAYGTDDRIKVVRQFIDEIS
ncbi:MAG TPA: hypothetical protein VJ521_10925, partial [Acidobacteriota bacterium]|nr:hypothetical protein [Acidobacteriota bacterium]